jgi:hypothetical protein
MVRQSLNYTLCQIGKHKPHVMGKLKAILVG